MRCESHGSTSPCTFIRLRFPVTIPITGFSFIRICGTPCPQPSWLPPCSPCGFGLSGRSGKSGSWRSEEHTSELQSHLNLVCRLLLEKKKIHIFGENSQHSARSLLCNSS